MPQKNNVKGAHAEPPPSVMDDVILDVADAARLLQVCPATLYRLTRSEKLPHVKLGRLLRFSKRSLLLWIEKKTTGIP